MEEDHTESRDYSSSLVSALSILDHPAVLKILHNFQSIDDKVKQLQEVKPFHILVQRVLYTGGLVIKTAAQLVYLLSLHGADVNQTNEFGETSLLCYVQECDEIQDELMTAFLRCGADMCQKNENGEDVLQFVLKSDLPKNIKHRVFQYMPGIWRAVDSDDVCTVRRLINQWCNINVVQEGMTVLQLAYSKGTENIIRVISGIGPPMDLAHGVLARDFQLVEQILKKKNTVNVNLKNMSEYGATPVFYAMCHNDLAFVKLLLQHGGRLDISMLAENITQSDTQVEIPLYFAALSQEPCIDVEILKHTVPTNPVHVDQLFYKGQNVIFYALENLIDLGLFEDILRNCSASVLTQRVEGNMDVREFAAFYGLEEYVRVIDQVVMDWCMDTENTDRRNTLCLHGYRLPLPITADDSENEAVNVYTMFWQLAVEYENYKLMLREAVENGEALRVREMLADSSWSQRGFHVCHADMRCIGDGQPLLHKALLRQHLDTVVELVNYILHKWPRKLDTFRDQYFRTGLHYVYGSEDSQLTRQLIGLLEDAGMSEYVMDKDGRSPLAFKDRRELKEMHDLLLYHIYQDFSEQPEPDPWSVMMPLPITGFLKKCLHHKHTDKHHHCLQHTHPQPALSPAHPLALQSNNNQTYHPTNSYFKDKADRLYYDHYDRNLHKCDPANLGAEFDRKGEESGGRRGAGFNGIRSQLSQSNDMLHTGIKTMGGVSEYDRNEYGRVSSQVSSLQRSKSENLFDTGYYEGRQVENDTDDFSDISSNRSDIGDNYEGDQSDVETDEEDEKNNPGENCTIL